MKTTVLVKLATQSIRKNKMRAALTMLGRFESVLRPPLVPLESRHEAVVRSALQHAGAL